MEDRQIEIEGNESYDISRAFSQAHEEVKDKLALGDYDCSNWRLVLIGTELKKRSWRDDEPIFYYMFLLTWK